MLKYILLAGLVGISLISYPIVCSHLQPKIDRLISQLENGAFDYIPDSRNGGCTALSGWALKISPNSSERNRKFEGIVNQASQKEWLRCRRTTILERFSMTDCGPGAIQTAAALCLGEMGPSAMEASSELVQVATGGTPDYIGEGLRVVRSSAIWALGEISDLKAINVVNEKLCHDEISKKKNELECMLMRATLGSAQNSRR